MKEETFDEIVGRALRGEPYVPTGGGDDAPEQPAAHVQKPAEIEHVADDVSKNGAELNMGAAYAEPTYLCQAWGETDLPSAAIVRGLDAVRAFLVDQWLGDADQEHDDGTKALPAAMAHMQEEWAQEGEAWKWSVNFEIGGVSVQRVDDVGASNGQAPAGALDEAFSNARAALLHCPDRESVRAVLETLRARVDCCIQKTAPASATLPDGWVPLVITHEGQCPEEVAYGPKIMMDRLGKWLGKYFAQIAAPAQMPDLQPLHNLLYLAQRQTSLGAMQRVVGEARLELAKVRAVLDTAPTAQAAPAGADVRRSDLVPGVMHCTKCKFQLNRVTLCVSDGNAYAGDNKTEPCPNGCGPLWPVTWEQEARNCWKTLEEMHERLQVAPAAGITVEQVEDAIGLQSTAWDTIGAEKIVEAVLRLANGQAPATQQAGWKLVPMVPTAAMVDAGCPVGEMVDHFDMATAYRSMLAAAPQPSPTTQAAESVPAIQGEMNVQLDIDSNHSAPGQQRDMACSLALGQPVGNGQDQAAGHLGAQGDKLLTVAERNIRSFLRSAVFKSESDREAALSCVDVLRDAAHAPADSVLEDAARLDFLIEQRAYVVSDPDACPGYWLHFVHKETGKCWVQCDEHPTPRAAIDAARKQGGTQ